ncbi:hypothetical protein DFH08DRAFT_824224 [Mycena albidolilacea]|uniref:Uncharacterized protein n=1 Tax=Mycena albidolilacea TaxID=1033008 RepID=A0AAD6Z522_9AGAR|nr:hypothetical protein DFH08DRAFT_824224 [Mycena albidolilacea]
MPWKTRLMVCTLAFLKPEHAALPPLWDDCERGGVCLCHITGVAVLVFTELGGGALLPLVGEAECACAISQAWVVQRVECSATARVCSAHTGIGYTQQWSAPDAVREMWCHLCQRGNLSEGICGALVSEKPGKSQIQELEVTRRVFGAEMGDPVQVSSI